MKKIIYLISIILIFTGCNKISKSEAEIRMQQKLDRVVSDNETIHNGLLYVFSESKEISAKMSAGFIDENIATKTDTPFFIASITKTFTSSVIMLLEEEGKMNIDDPIINYLNANILENLFVVEGVDYSNKVTIRELLNMTSGVADYFLEEMVDGNNGIDILLNEKDRIWESTETIKLVSDTLKPKFVHGQGTYYSDTSYQLLGLIIESVTGKNLEEVYSEMIFKPLKMNNSWLYMRSDSERNNEQIASIWFDDVNVTNYRSLSSVGADGGIISTLDDLMIFIRALEEGTLFKENDTYSRMQQWNELEKGRSYGLGIMHFDLPELTFFFIGMPEMYGNSGSTGSYLYYCPEYDFYMVGTLNQLSFERDAIIFLSEIIRIMMSVE